MKSRPLSRLRTAGVAGGAVAARGQLRVERLELARPHGPAEPRRGVGHALRAALAQVGLARQPRELARERLAVARLEQQAEVAVLERLLVLRQPRGHRHGPAGHRAQHERARARGAAPDAATAIERARAGPRAIGGPMKRTRSRSAGPAAGGAAPRPVAQPDRRVPRQVGGSLRSAAGRSAAPRAPPRPRRGSRAGSSRAIGRGARSAPGGSPVVAREVALDQVARRPEGRRAPVEAAEQAARPAARRPGRAEALGRRVEGADVERARVAQRGLDALGANGSCTWTKSSARVSEQRLDRARHVERQRHRAAAPRRRNGIDCPTPSTSRSPASANTRPGLGAALTISRDSRISSRESDGATTQRGDRARQSSSESRST